MFAKLLKYEFKSVGKWYLALYALVLAIAIVVGFWLRSNVIRAETSEISNAEATLLGFVMFAFAAILITIGISTLFLIVNRFRHNIYGRQGYLTMTLPVSAHHLILSKLVAALLWSLLAAIVAILSLLVAFSISGIDEFLGTYTVVTELTDIPSILQYGFAQFISTVNSVLLIYFSISIGQLFKDYRTLMAFIAYFSISSIVGIISSLFYLSELETLYGTSLSILPNPILTFISILLAFGYYFGTHYIMSKKLNLQ
ncbi:ABC transporter permease [Streptococcus suis]|uniref:ABC transporter permease n=1 Tax=Streptococcus suis TaxID=1307 RepID=UPI001ABEDBAB|nr:ABC transporter permease [Streptococcus suis]